MSYRNRVSLLPKWMRLAALGWLSCPLYASIQIQQLTPSLASPQPLGTVVTWQATASDSNPGTLEYRFSAKPITGPIFFLQRDFHTSPSVEWSSIQREGVAQIQVTVRNTSTEETAQLTVAYQLTSRVVGGAPVVNPTAHPLVALYSAPQCPSGSNMRVRFQRAGATFPDVTSPKPCNGAFSMNFYLAGLRASSNYSLRHEIITGTGSTFGPVLNFATGVIPGSVQLPNFTVLMPPNAQTGARQKFLLYDFLDSTRYGPMAVDLNGNVVWYYDRVVGPPTRFFHRLITGGTLLVIVNDLSIPDPQLQPHQILREIDLPGHTLRETNVKRVSDQLLDMGWQEGITSFHHEAIRLPNGHTLVLCSNERIFPAGTQGSTGPIDIIGDAVVDLDQNFQVAWAWNAFDHMDIARKAILNETCAAGGGGCPPLTLGTLANDWLHSNSLNYIPANGDFLISIRHQDWVVRINYNNGTGPGDVVWRLGKDGDFALSSPDPYPWFSHQHDSGYDSGYTDLIRVRQRQHPGSAIGRRQQPRPGIPPQ